MGVMATVGELTKEYHRLKRLWQESNRQLNEISDLVKTSKLSTTELEDNKKKVSEIKKGQSVILSLMTSLEHEFRNITNKNPDWDKDSEDQTGS